MGRIMGTVKFFNALKGFGAIDGDDGHRYLFFYRDVLRKNKFLKAKQRVLFATIKDAHGVRAVEVRVVGK